MSTGSKQLYVLTRALAFCLGLVALVTLSRLVGQGFDLGALKNSDFLIEMGFLFLFSFPFACIAALRTWRAKNEKKK